MTPLYERCTRTGGNVTRYRLLPSASGGRSGPQAPSEAAVVTQGVILAGGPDTTLFPLANMRSRLTMPLGNAPAFALLASFLAKNGIREVAIVGNQLLERGETLETLSRCLPQELRCDVYVEDHPCGTAGALIGLNEFLDGSPILLMNASSIPLGLDLRLAAREHLERDAELTVLVGDGGSERSWSEQVLMDESGGVKDFELLHSSQASGPHVRSAGAYLLGAAAVEVAQEDEYLDVKEQLVATLNERSLKVISFPATGRFRQIVSLEDYVDASKDPSVWALAGEGSERRVLGPDTWAEAGATVSPDAVLSGPVLLGRGCTVGAGCVVEGPTVLGSGVRLSSGAKVKNSVVWNDVSIGEGADLGDVVIADGCRIGTGMKFRNALIVRAAEPAAAEYLRLTTGSSENAGRIPYLNREERAVQVQPPQWYPRFKRTLDFFLSLIALVVLSPLFAVIAASIKLDSRGPAFFVQRRCGLGGETFPLVKFRTMVADATELREALEKQKDVSGPMFKLKRDPRITRLGRALRNSSLDELPQLISVLRGDMSLVGPRPLVMKEMDYAPAWRDIRLSVKPGVSGLWQISGRNTGGFHDWIRYDTQYVREKSLWLDVKIMLLTLPVLLKGAGDS